MTTASSPDAAAEPARSGGSKPPFLSQRTIFGAAFATMAGCAVLFFVYVGRPWLIRHGVRLKFDEDVTSALKGLLAVAAVSLSLVETMRRLRKLALPRERTVRIIAGVFAGLGALGYLTSDDLDPARYHHDWEQFHYYVGSKYASELGYKRIYVCAAVAQSELGPEQEQEVRRRKIRDLESNVLVPAKDALENPDACKEGFSPERWEEFKADATWFRFHDSADYWARMNEDHGYNAPPVWTMVGHAVASMGRVSEAVLSRLAGIDLVLLVVAFFGVWWAFGYRALAVSLVFFGAQFPSNGFFTGGAFLRQDWLLFLVLSVCFAKKGRYYLAGGALTWSALLRIFPAIFFAGWIVLAVAHFVRKRRIHKAHRQLFVGAAAAGLVLVGASLASTGTRGYTDFITHIRLHADTPLTNNMGLPQVMGYSTEGRVQRVLTPAAQDPFAEWARLYKENRDARRPIYWISLLGVFGLFVAAVWRTRSAFVAEILGLALVTSLATLTCYYYAFFILAPLLGRLARRFEQGALLVAAASAWVILWPRISREWDDRYLVESLLFFGFSLFMLASFAARKRRAPRPRPPVERVGDVTA